MNITIEGTTYELNLGYRFSNALDKVYTLKQDMGNGQEMEIGVGVQMLYSYLAMGNFDSVVQFYLAGLSHHKKKPSQDKIIEAVEEKAAEVGIDDLADECVEGLRESGFYKRLFKQIEEQTEQ